MDQLRLISLQSGSRRGHDDKSVDARWWLSVWAVAVGAVGL